MNNKFLLMWDCNGLEFIYDLSAWERRKVWATLKDIPVTDNPPPLNMLIMRARYNIQRHYEIYIIETSDDENTMRDYFNESPQAAADLVRERGHMLYSDRASQSPAIV